MKKLMILFAILLATTISKSQTILTRWTFDDSSVSFPSPMPGDGVGTAVLTGGTTNATSWPAGKGTGKRLSVTTFPAQGSNSGTAGISFATSTQGKSGITLCYYLKLSNTASRYHQVKYTTDGTTWNTFTLTPTNSTISNVSTGGNYAFDYTNNVIMDSGVQSTTIWGLIKLDFSTLPVVDNNPNFGVFISTVFDPTTGSNTYSPATSTKTYGAGGTFGLDSVTVSYNNLLPISIKSFNASVFNTYVKLNWDVYSDGQFDVEKSTDGVNFTKIGTTTKNTYNDVTVRGLTYYRLKVIQNDGNFTYSNIITVNRKSISTLSVYPNPSTSTVTINYKSPYVSIYTTDGRFVKSYSFPKESIQSTIDVSSYQPGSYLITSNNETTFFIKK